MKLLHDEQLPCSRASCEHNVDLDVPDVVRTPAGKSNDPEKKTMTFNQFRLQYLGVFGAIMLADGLQGTHLYALYEGYNFNVANLYAIGFATGAVASPFMGPVVDKFGRRNSALVYCALEMFINALEQYKCMTGLLVSRMIGGITTNLLFTVFESWVVTEHRKRGYPEDKLEFILRDSVIISNVLAVASGILAELLADAFGLTGPFKGAVCSTFFALLLVYGVWGENYGSEDAEQQNVGQIMKAAVSTIFSDSKICRIGLIQGLTEGALQTFIFLWCPALLFFSRDDMNKEGEEGTLLRYLSDLAKTSTGEPAFGFIFGAYMAAGAVGGWLFPVIRRLFRALFGWMWVEPSVAVTLQAENPPILLEDSMRHNQSDSEEETEVDSYTASPTDDEAESLDDEVVAKKSYEYEVLGATCYAVCAFLLAIPTVIGLYPDLVQHKFEVSLVAFVIYEILVGVYMPCEGILRTKYMPNESICSLMTILRVIVNLAVAFGVSMTNVVSLTTAFGLCSGALAFSSILQLSLVKLPALVPKKIKLGAISAPLIDMKSKKD